MRVAITPINREVVSKTWLLDRSPKYLSLCARIKPTVGIYISKQIVLHTSCTLLSAKEGRYPADQEADVNYSQCRAILEKQVYGITK